MSPVTQRLPRLSAAARTRLLMIGAVVGALLALAISVPASPALTGAVRAPGTILPDGAGAPLSRGEERTVFDAPVGSCLQWSGSDGRDMREVSCTDRHVFEITQIIDVSGDYPDDAPPPDIETWRGTAIERCAEGVDDYLGKPFDPKGKFGVSALRPNEHDWQRGTRELRCGLWWAGPAGGLQETTKPAAEMDQSDVWPKGTCLAITGRSVGDPIDCTKKHSYEMIAVVDLSKKFGDDYPSQKKQNAWLDERCFTLADDYTGGLDLEDEGLVLAWDTRGKKSWAAGSYKVNCKVGMIRDDKSGLAPLTGSIAEGAEEEESKEKEEEQEQSPAEDDTDGGDSSDRDSSDGDGSDGDGSNGDGEPSARDEDADAEPASSP